MSEPVRQLGRYELLKRIAKGGMGEIYLARVRGAAGFEKLCIIKTILGHLAEEEEFVTKFLDEGRIVVQLGHGNIVPVFDMGEEEGEYFIAMEYIPGRDLREVTKRLQSRGEVMPVDLALFVASEVCKGLDYAHRKTGEDGQPLGIVHRDVSPSNILISREGEVKLIDFGIARAAGRLSKTVSGRIQGKFCYMSPEQASGKQLDGRSDIFSAGTVLYELLTGFRPFEGDSDLESLELVRRCEFDPPSTLNGEIPDEVDAIVQTALARDPSERYSTIDKFQIALLQYLYSTGSSPTSNDVERFLGELFPEGLEREELRSARDSGSPRPGKMSLEDALEFELERMAGEGAVDPHETTAISSGASDLRRQMMEISEGETATGSPPVTADTSPEPRSTAASEGRRSVWGIVLVCVMLAGAGIVYGTSRPEKGLVHVVTDPPGAQMIVDDVTVLGKETPGTLELAPGRHVVRLEKDGFHARTVTIEIAEGSEKTIDGSAGRLKPLKVPEGPREIAISVTPEDAVLTSDGAQFGTGRGVLVIQPNSSVKVTIEHPRCQPLNYIVPHAFENDELHLELSGCQPLQAPDAGEPTSPASGGDTTPASTLVKVVIDSEPAGAQIEIDGAPVGTAPVEREFPSRKLLRVRATKPGYEPLDVKRRAGAIRGTLNMKLREAAQPKAQGCLNVRLTYPVTAQIAIDGKWLPDNQEYGLRELPLSAGPHEVRVKNDAVNVDQSFTVQVKAGDACALHVFDSRKKPKPD